jgi:hypothetical protein
VFVKKEVDTSLRLYKKNPGADFTDYVDDTRIFDFVEYVRSQSEDNWTHVFEDVTDIVAILKTQFAFIHLLFSEQFVRARTTTRVMDGKPAKRVLAPFPGDFTQLTDGMENAEAASIQDGLRRVHQTLARMTAVGGYEEKARVLWVLGRHARVGGLGAIAMSMSEPSFKQYTGIGATKGRRIFQQLSDFDVSVSYEPGEDAHGAPRVDVDLRFHKDVDGIAAYALERYAKDLVKRFGEEEGLELFLAGDMRLYGAE